LFAFTNHDVPLEVASLGTLGSALGRTVCVIQVPELAQATMSNLVWLTDVHVERLRQFFSKIHGRRRVDDR
jgi:hypothetical protein